MPKICIRLFKFNTIIFVKNLITGVKFWKKCSKTTKNQVFHI